MNKSMQSNENEVKNIHQYFVRGACNTQHKKNVFSMGNIGATCFALRISLIQSYLIDSSIYIPALEDGLVRKYTFAKVIDNLLHRYWD